MENQSSAPAEWPESHGHPLVDAQYERCAIAAQSRPLVSLSAGIADAYHYCVLRGASLVLLTPSTSRVTFPLRALLNRPGLEWVVTQELDDQASGVAYADGLTGAPLIFDGGGFVVDPSGPSHPGRASPAAETRSGQLLCTVTVQHPASLRLRLDAASALCAGLTGAMPTGWGTAEPASQPWDEDAVTTYARRRAPEPARLVVTGEGFIATLETSRTDTGVDEDVVALISEDVINAGAGQPGTMSPVERARSTLAAMADHMTVAFATVQRGDGRADLTASSSGEGSRTPVAMLIGPRACRSFGLDVLEAAPLPAPRRVGRERLPGLLYRLEGEHDQAWAAIAAFIDDLGAERIQQAAPGVLWPG